MGDEGTEAEITDDVICLNGLQSYETFLLERCMEPRPWRREEPRDKQLFAFCKTARCPYDTVVTAILCLAEHYSDGFFRVTSDGTLNDWEDGLRLANKVAKGVQIPPQVADPECLELD